MIHTIAWHFLSAFIRGMQSDAVRKQEICSLVFYYEARPVLQSFCLNCDNIVLHYGKLWNVNNNTCTVWFKSRARQRVL